MIKKYRTDIGYDHIQLIEIEKETDKSVWINGCRELKRSGWRNYFDTWQEAQDFLIKMAQNKYDYAKDNLDSANKTLEKVKCLNDKNN